MKTVWYCECGIANLNHYIFCARCGEPRPAPPPPPKSDKKKPISNYFPKSERPDLDAKIKIMRNDKISYGKIAEELGISKNAVVGRADRMKRRGEI